MPSTPETYRFAAREHLERAYRMHKLEDYFMAHLLAGLAVECHLRAQLLLISRKFESRHDLQDLAKEAKFFDHIPVEFRRELSNALSNLNLRWRSNHRYYSERQLLDYMNLLRVEYNSSGSRWKNLSRTLLNLSTKIIKQGEAKWNLRSQKNKL